MDRISTGITGLDSLIDGGIPRGSTVLVAGNPGTGKTILTSHFLFDGLKKGENGLFVSFNESKSQYFINMEKLGMDLGAFESRRKLVYLDFTSVTEKGMRDALEEVLATVMETKVKRLVIDSITAISHSYQNQIAHARIIYQTILGKIMRLEGVTSMLIAEIPTGTSVVGLGIEESLTDGIILLRHGSSDASPLTLNVVKMRGTRIIKEPHICVIDSGRGITVYPKQSLNLTFSATNERLASGISGIDQRTGGGLLKGTATGIIGAAGTGKTTFAFQFIAEGIKRGEAGLFYSFEESADEVRRMAENFGYDVEELERNGLVIMAKNAEYQSPDAFIAEISNGIEKGHVKRLAIDDLTSFEHTTMHEGDSVYVIAKRLASLARQNGITTIFPVLSTQQANVILDDLGGLSRIFQNIILLRHVEIEGSMRRTMIPLKMRSTRHDQSILQFDISPIETGSNNDRDDSSIGSWWTEGPIKITGSIDGYAGILTGIAQRFPLEIKEEEKLLRKQTAAKAGRREEFQRKEENIASRLQSKREQRISEYPRKRLKKKGGDGKERVGKTKQGRERRKTPRQSSSE